MTYPVDSTSIFPHLNAGMSSARGLVRTVENGKFSLEAEKTEEEKRLESSVISSPRQLSPEEEKRVLYLQNLLAQIMTMVDGHPTDEQKERIKEIEKELEEITGVKMRSNISDMTAKMPGKKDDEEEEEAKRKMQMQLQGIDPKDAIHAKMPEKSNGNNPGIMQFVRNNAINAYLKNSLSESLDASTLLGASGTPGSLKV